MDTRRRNLSSKRDRWEAGIRCGKGLTPNGFKTLKISNYFSINHLFLYMYVLVSIDWYVNFYPRQYFSNNVKRITYFVRYYSR